MVQPSQLTVSGILYEGSDFDDWKRRILAGSSMRKLRHFEVRKSFALVYTSNDAAQIIEQATEKTRADQATEIAGRRTTEQRLAYIVALTMDNPRRTVKSAWEDAMAKFPDPPKDTPAPNLNTPALPASMSGDFPSMPWRPLMKHERAREMEFACDNICPSILARLPKSVVSDLGEFWRRLPDYARPFRLLDLPQSVRSRIYMITLDAQTPDSIRTSSSLLLSVSKQVRTETRPLLFASGDFRVRHETQKGECTTQLLSLWLKRFARDDSKFLQTVTIDCHARRSLSVLLVPIWVAFKYADAKGLSCSPSVRVTDASASILSSHIKNIEATRLAMGLRGEAIGMAILSRPELWNGTLELSLSTPLQKIPVMPTDLTSGTQPGPTRPQTSSSSTKFPIPKSLLLVKGGSDKLQGAASTRQ
ncbi:hypothetical protein Slin15195_G074000 [Septoria linicola]|uniref:Uncharacterized protein n=1 Tax=Septoria linicola TaxID=215465 RepID=A0A9Q9AYH0_9PEZI|nr:hypothetical protein Slin14017_G035130 [Septoria linicola]USW54081.1 hypothetical protein Slin15195_G074000 [Septoria linicola]